MPGHAVGADEYGPKGGTGGGAFVFARSGRGWYQATELAVPGLTHDDDYGTAVAIDTGTVVGGDPLHPGGGRTFVFAGTGSGWS